MRRARRIESKKEESMKYADAWKELKKIIAQDANASGAMMSMAEHTWTTEAAERYLRLMNRLEEKHE